MYLSRCIILIIVIHSLNCNRGSKSLWSHSFQAKSSPCKFFFSLQMASLLPLMLFDLWVLSSLWACFFINFLSVMHGLLILFTDGHSFWESQFAVFNVFAPRITMVSHNYTFLRFIQFIFLIKSLISTSDQFDIAFADSICYDMVSLVLIKVSTKQIWICMFIFSSYLIIYDGWLSNTNFTTYVN